MTAVIRKVSILLRLGKPRIALMVGITAFTGAVAGITQNHNADTYTVLLVTLLTIFTAYGAAVINNYLDRDIDRAMNRTKNRPIVAGEISAPSALRLGVFTVALSVMLMYFIAGVLPALLALTAALSYTLIYTIYLKRTTPWASIIGAVPGALPPLIGYSAISGRVDMQAMVLFLILLIWQPPHFWHLAMMLEGDYRRAGIPVLPVVYGRAFTRRLTLIFSLLMSISLLLPCALNMVGSGYCTGAVILSLLWTATSLLSHTGKVSNRLAFVMSNLVVLFTFLLFALETTHTL